MSPAAPARCVQCGALEGLYRLERCSICHRRFCRRCAARRHGKMFCSASCADFFFFGSPDDGEGADG
jgi:hypothetical protein